MLFKGSKVIKKDTKTGRFLKGGGLPIKVRFMAKVIKTPTCWLWIGAKTRDGYGHIIYNGRYRKATQIAWDGKPFPEGLGALHTCNNPRCVNPKHIYPGTNLDNHLDAVQSGTFLFGESSPNAKLTFKQVREIRNSLLKQRELAEICGVTQGHISAIRNHRKWKKRR